MQSLTRSLPQRKMIFVPMKAAFLSRLALPLIIGLGLAASPARAQVVLFDNLSVGSRNGNTGVSNAQWTAQGFSTTSSDFTLRNVSLELWNPSGTTGNFQIQVWDSAGALGSPGAQVGAAIYTGLAQNLNNGSGVRLLSIDGLSVPLSANRLYYLVAKGTSLTPIGSGPFSDFGYLAWDFTSVNASPSYAKNGGSDWGSPLPGDFYMKVEAIPEPGTITLLLVSAGIGLPLYCRHRRRSALR